MDKYSGTVISDMDNRAILKIITAREYATQKSVLLKLKNECGITIPQPTFSNKIKRNDLNVYELQKICEIFDFDIILRPKNT